MKTVIDRVVEGGVLTRDQANCFSALFVDKEEDMRALLEQSGPHGTVIEIGTYNGMTASVIAEYAKRVHTFDVCVRPEAQKVTEFLGHKHVTFHRVDPQNVQAEEDEIARIIREEAVTLAFVDGEHYGIDPARDYGMVKAVKHVLFHDYRPEAFPDVSALVESLPVDTTHTKIHRGSFLLYSRLV